MVADPPKKHLGGHALVDAVQQLLDKARAHFSRGELQRVATLELPLGGTQPAPRAFGIAEDTFSQRGNAGETYGSIRFFATERLVPCATVRQRTTRHDE